MTGEIEQSDVRELTYVLGHDSAGLFGRTTVGAVIARRSFNRVALLGDSTVAQVHVDGPKRNRSIYNHFNVGNALAGNRAIITGNYGVSGERTDQTLARLATALSSGAGTLYISEGINSMAQAPYVHAVSGLTISATAVGLSAFADTLQKVDAALALGMKVIVTLCHGSASFTAVQIAQLAIYNSALRSAAEVRPNLWLFDAPAVLRNHLTSTTAAVTFKAGYMRTGETATHEGALGSYFAGKEFARILRDVMRPIPRHVGNNEDQYTTNNRTQLVANPAFLILGTAGTLGTGGSLKAGTSAVPDGWSVIRASGDTTTTFSVGVEANADGFGNDLVIDYTASVAGGGLRVQQSLAGASSAWLAGDQIQGFSTISVMAGATGLASACPQIESNGDSASLFTYGMLGDTSGSGSLPSVEGFTFEDATEALTIPAYTTKGYLAMRALQALWSGAGTGTIRLRMPRFTVKAVSLS